MSSNARAETVTEDAEDAREDADASSAREDDGRERRGLARVGGMILGAAFVVVAALYAIGLASEDAEGVEEGRGRSSVGDARSGGEETRPTPTSARVAYVPQARRRPPAKTTGA